MVTPSSWPELGRSVPQRRQETSHSERDLQVSVPYEIGPFRLDPEAGVLTRDGKPAALGPRAVAVLKTLVEHANEYVPKASIIDAAWPGLVVEENNLSVQITGIRRVLAQAGGKRWIETLPRRGYRFIGPVKQVREGRTPESTSFTLRSNLPEPLTSFVGRDRELAEMKRLLPNRRLLTIIGVGGIGKTRLALQLAAEVTDAYRDGVWLVDLAPLADPALVPSAVAQVLGVREEASKPVLETLCGSLKRRQLLLILDNCEHVLGECTRLAEAALKQASGLTIIATSREPLQVEGEQIYALSTLSLPDQSASTDSMQRSEAVTLFLERAQLQQPGFALTPERTPVVAELCIHLDGIPLALELAAARIRSLSVEQIHARLGDRFGLLSKGGRVTLPRHQTLRATFDWSYDLLTDSERAVLRRLAVFPGSFSAEAAAAVAADATIEAFAVTNLLSQLVARSLIIADTSEGSTRYLLLETTRSYTLERLAAAGECEVCKRRHAEYFRGLFEHAPNNWLRMPDALWHARYVTELINVRAALSWSLGVPGNEAIGISLAGASGTMWMELSLQREGREWVEAALGRAGAHMPDSDQANMLLSQGLLFALAAPTQALTAFERAVDIYRRLSDTPGLGYSLAELGARLAHVGQYDRATSALAEAFAVLERMEVPKALARCFRTSGLLKVLTGNAAGARADYEKALSLYRDAGAERDALETLDGLADAIWTLGDLDTALAIFHQTVGQLRTSRWATQLALGKALSNLVGVLTERGDVQEALAAAQESVSLLLDGGYAWINMDHLALRAGLAGKIQNAARLVGFADATCAAKRWIRQPNEARARGRLQALLDEKLSPDELEQLLTEGAKMNEEEACRLALEK